MEICATLYDQSKDLCIKNGTIDPRVMQYLPRPVGGNYCDFRTSWLADFYKVCAESTQFYMSLKPWRVITVQHHKANIKLLICCNASKEQLLKLLNGGLLASSILFEDYDYNASKFAVLLTASEKLHDDIKNIYVTFGFPDTATSPEEICRALIDLPRLRRLWVLKPVGAYYNKGNWSAAVLFSQVRDGYIQMHPVHTLNTTVTTLAYKSLKMEVNESVDNEHWTKYAHLCTRLEHLTIQMAYGFDMMPLIPPNLVSLAILSFYAPNCIIQTELPEIRLQRMVLHSIDISWKDFAAWCLHIRFLELRYLTIKGPITASLRLTHLNLGNMQETSGAAFMRYMSKVTLHRLELKLSEEILDIEFNDWISNPEFLVGTHVTWSCTSTNIYRKRNMYRKRAELFFRQSLSKIQKANI